MMRPLRLFALASLFVATATLQAQTEFGAGAFSPTTQGAGRSIGVGGRSVADLLGGAQKTTPKFTGGFELAPDGNSGLLTITAQIPPKHHVFSLTQPKGAIGVKSTLTLLSTDVVALDARGFQASPSPTESLPPGSSVAGEIHEGTVEWVIPFRVISDVGRQSMAIRVQYDGQICSDIDENGEGGFCERIDPVVIEATYQGTLRWAPQFVGAGGEPEAAAPPAQFVSVDAFESAAAITTEQPYRAKDSAAAIEIAIAPRVAKPGETVTLSVKAKADDKWHVYALEPTDPKRKGSKPTLIVLENPRTWMTGTPRASADPIVAKSTVPDLPDQQYHDEVVWTWTWTVPETAEPGLVPVTGLIGYQTCKDESCQAPLGVRFSAQIAIGEEAAAGASNHVAVEASKYTTVANLAAARPDDPAAPAASQGATKLQNLGDLESAEKQGSSLALALVWAFLGGLLLNVMPCVLPVLGLKVYSFIEMAGESRAKVFWHNVAYIFGLLAVFWALGTVAVAFETVSFYAGNKPLILTMTGVVFAMALSFLGLWEIPIPGFAGTSKLNKLADRESLSGAFFKGVIATILATPCGAPMMSFAFYDLFGRNPLEIYLIFTALGVGMAFPYFLIALNPQIVARVLPKPGPWMNVFKQALAFLLLGTVAYLISTLEFWYAVPTLVFVFGIWLACWIVGTGQHHFYGTRRMTGAWVVAGIVAAFSALFSYSHHGVLGAMQSRFDDRYARIVGEWQPYSFETLQEYAAQNKTVVVDFTADWCPNCKVLEATVLASDEVKAKFAEQEVETLVADYTDRPEDVRDLLAQLTGSDLIPVLAIFPAGRPNDPIVLAGGYTTNTLLAELDKANSPAGASPGMRSDEPTVAAAEPTGAMR